MTTTIREMTAQGLDLVIDLMRDTPGITLRVADAEEPLLRYLSRNPGLSFVAETKEDLIGCLMAGHDGRRGYLNHLIVAPAHRRQGIGSKLVAAALASLSAEGIRKSHIDILVTNDEAKAFWQKLGWSKRNDVIRYSIVQDGDPNT